MEEGKWWMSILQVEGLVFLKMNGSTFFQGPISNPGWLMVRVSDHPVGDKAGFHYVM